MLANIAIGMLETSSIAKGVEATDAMCKMASVELVKATIVARGKYTILIKGPVGEVESSLRAGANIAGTGMYTVPVSWQGMADTFAPTATCAKSLYGSETKRRTVWVTMRLATLAAR